MMRMVYEQAPFEPVAPEGVRAPAGRQLAEVVAEHGALDEDYVVDYLFERGQTYYIAARFKTGKGLLLNDVIDAVATGGSFLGREARKCTVLWLQLEDSPRSIVRRWRRRYPSGDIPQGIIIDQESWRLTEDNLAATVEQIKSIGASLVVIDPLINAMPPHNLNDATESRAVMELFRRLSRESNAVVLLVAHHRKAEGEFGDQISGSHQQGAAIDGFIEIRRTNTKGQRRISLIGRDWPDLPDELVEIDEDTLRLKHLGSYADIKEDIRREQALKDSTAITNIVPDEGSLIRQDELKKKVGLSDKRFKTALAVAIASGALVVEVICDSDGKPLRGKPKGVRRGSM